MFTLHTSYTPSGDQPQAISKLLEGLKEEAKYQLLLGITGSGKTYTMASVIASTGRPALVISPNKTLAAQLYQEFKEFFPENSVHYFVSYYDYYQPEAYIPQTNTYIEKDAKVNQEIDRLRHAAVQSVLSRRDTIVIASVSCIYNIGSPKGYRENALSLERGKKLSRKALLSSLVKLQYERAEEGLSPGTFRVRGDTVEVHLVTGNSFLRVGCSSGPLRSLAVKEGEGSYEEVSSFTLFPAHFWTTPEDQLPAAIRNIEAELEQHLRILRGQKKKEEAERLERRTRYDLELLQETGWCHGIENYSRHMEFRAPGSPPSTILEYFPEDFLVFVDESHLTLSQIRAMAIQDRQRKEALIEYGFRLPSAVDNRPLAYEEFEERTGQVIYVSATPSPEEKRKAGAHLAEQIIRPTGLLDPSVEVRPAKGQLKDLVREVRSRAKKGQRVLALTLTKRLAEALSDRLTEEGISCRWLHSEIKTMERPQILKELREGSYDVLVGINLLREGLDLPEVALVAILDADKEGFLRSEPTLLQMMGRAARHPEGHVVLYADAMSESMESAVREVERRRDIQMRYNKEHGILPKAISKPVREWLFQRKEGREVEFGLIKDVSLLKKEMKKAAENLDFERAAQLRDMIEELKSKKK